MYVDLAHLVHAGLSPNKDMANYPGVGDRNVGVLSIFGTPCVISASHAARYSPQVLPAPIRRDPQQLPICLPCESEITATYLLLSPSYFKQQANLQFM